MHLRTMRVQADLDGVDPERAQALRLFFVDHHRIGLDLDVEKQPPCVLQQLEEVAADEDFTSADRQEEDARLGELVQDALDFLGRHLAMIFVIEITVHAALIAAVGNVEVDGDRYAEIEGLLAHFTEQGHGTSPACGPLNGRSETRRIPCCARSLTNSFASACACSESISNCAQTWSFTISRRGVRPSAACQIAVATSLSVKNVESFEFMTIISPASMRAAIL